MRIGDEVAEKKCVGYECTVNKEHFREREKTIKRKRECMCVCERARKTYVCVFDRGLYIIQYPCFKRNDMLPLLCSTKQISYST